MEKYLINKEIGCGSFGKVFVVESKKTGIQYVAKQIDVSKLSSRQKYLAQKEFYLLSTFKHPNIVRYKEAFIDERNVHIVMELCELGDLHASIQEAKLRNQLFTDSQTMQYFVQICHAINYLHQQRIIHRDLKTKNIFLKKGNVIKLGDFGVAKILDNSFELANTCIGSPFYISPEICESKPYDRKSDIWSLGCVLFEIVTFKYAFQAKSMKALLAKITTGQHAAVPPSTNPSIRKIIKKLLHENPKMRPNVSDILSLPYVVQYSSLNHATQCKSNSSYSSFNSKSVRSLPISKNCLNIKGGDISVPEEKYVSQKKLVKMNNAPAKLLTYCKQKNSNDTVNILLKKQNDNLKIKKLPKTDCLYYNLIEKNKKEQVEGVKNHNLENDLLAVVQPENVKPDMNIFSQNNFINKIRGDDLSNERKRWQTGTADREELLLLLNNAKLQSHQATSLYKDEGSKSVEDLLFMNTGELLHVQLIQPVLLPTPIPTINQQTFIIHQQAEGDGTRDGVFEHLEQRRILLERQLGLDKFLKVYKRMEELQKKNIYKMLSERDEKEITAVFNITDDQVQQVYRLLLDDHAYLL